MQQRAIRRHKKVGWPEVWLACSVALAVVPATLWWRQQYAPEWKRTAGTIASSDFARVHYNAQDYRTKARVSYEYSVGMAKYAGVFDGFWPEVGGPNALAPSDIEQLQTPHKEVFVFYDPDNPARSTLHPEQTGSSPLWPVLTIAGLCLAAAYTFIAYPAWRA